MARTKQNQRKQKRHAPDVCQSEAKKLRREQEEKWKSTRSDQPSSDASQRYAFQMRNERFNAFYQSLGIVREDEWESFMESLLQPLPACFHMNPDYAFTAALKKQLSAIMDEIKVQHAVSSTIGEDSKPLVPIEMLKW